MKPQEILLITIACLIISPVIVMLWVVAIAMLRQTFGKPEKRIAYEWRATKLPVGHVDNPEPYAWPRNPNQKRKEEAMK